MQLEKRYDPKKVEEKWYRFWEENGFFNSDVNKSRVPFTIVIPPPNITGVLHMGHGLNNTLQDILIRLKRMQGYNALWIPGTDHAGIATQNVVERDLAKENKTRHEVGREKFIELVWKWRERYGSIIIKQLRKFGASCDWRRERFTMDEGLSLAVREVFVRLFKEGLIYRGKYIINWCPRCQTALADEEVEHESEKGFLYYIKYPFKDDPNEGLIIATTRPETMLGDTAVAVNPEDKRYKNAIGRSVILPLVERVLPVIADEYVDMEFGTGALKITPAHDPNDFEIGKKHGLQQINIFNEDATINNNGISECIGMDRYECREVIVEELKKHGYFIKQEPYTHEVGHCYRCSTVIEPYLSEQWFVKMKPLAEPAIRVVEEDRIRFFPERWKKVYLNWMYNIKDWCISRQIWWGHRIPVYYCDDCGEMFASVEEPDKCEKCSGENIRQDEDVLDTWFSSQLWPFSTLGWPKKTPELEYYYPTSVLVTDPGILFFWVARMIMSGLKFMGDIPFRDVFIHGVVMDQFGRKMSKSLGNGIDPLEVVEKFGADAMRYTIVAITPLGQNLLLSMDKFNIGLRFANKIWNASRFILMNVEGLKLVPPLNDELEVSDRWILTAFNQTVKRVLSSIDSFRINEAANLIYEFFWHEFCDWYVEMSKVRLYGRDEKKRNIAGFILLKILEGSLRLLHPFIPFITEEIWQRLPIKKDKPSIMICEYPEYNQDEVYPESVEDISKIKELCYLIRNIRGELRVPPDKKITVYIKTIDAHTETLIKNNTDVVKFLTKSADICYGGDVEKPPQSGSGVGSGFEVYVPLKGLIDIEKEMERLNKELEKLDIEIQRSERKLNNRDFLKKAPKEVVDREKRVLEESLSAKKRLKYLVDSLKM